MRQRLRLTPNVSNKTPCPIYDPIPSPLGPNFGEVPLRASFRKRRGAPARRVMARAMRGDAMVQRRGATCKIRAHRTTCQARLQLDLSASAGRRSRTGTFRKRAPRCHPWRLHAPASTSQSEILSYASAK
jgi:hypothetical protein